MAGRSGGETKVVPYTEQTKQEFEWGLDRFLEEARVLRSLVIIRASSPWTQYSVITVPLTW